MSSTRPRAASLTARFAAGLIAGLAGLGLLYNFEAVSVVHASVAGSVWALLRYFTITTNLLVAVLFAVLARKGPAALDERLLGGLMLSIVLVGVVYVLLLRGQFPLSGKSAVANVLLHYCTPVLVPLYWLAWTDKGRLQRRDPALWALYPLAYFLYALARGHAEGRYAYPFIDVAALGWDRTLLNAAAIAVAFLAAGALVLGLDRLLAKARFVRGG